jgi:hypothetical protein
VPPLSGNGVRSGRSGIIVGIGGMLDNLITSDVPVAHPHNLSEHKMPSPLADVQEACRFKDGVRFYTEQNVIPSRFA